VKAAFKIKAAGEALILGVSAVLISSQKRAGGTMTTHIVQNKRYPNSAWAERKQDLLLVSSFGLWALLLGLSPVLALRLFIGS
jgi:hypothetical protein